MIDVSDINTKSVRRAAEDFMRQRTMVRAIEDSNVICWACDEEDNIIFLEGDVPPINHKSFAGKNMAGYPGAQAYFFAKEKLEASHQMSSIQVSWVARGQRWVGTFSPLYHAGRRAGIIGISLPVDNVIPVPSEDPDQTADTIFSPAVGD